MLKLPEQLFNILLMQLPHNVIRIQYLTQSKPTTATLINQKIKVFSDRSLVNNIGFLSINVPGFC